MQTWEIEYYLTNTGKAPVKEFIDSMPLKARARTFKTFELIEEYGLRIGEPHIKYLEENLWEIRVRAEEGVFRFIFTISGKKIIVLLHGFQKKTRKTAQVDLRIARNRAKDQNEEPNVERT